MSERIDHAAEARAHIEYAHDWQAGEGDTTETGLAHSLIAIAESQLALVEQQRIANQLFAHTRGGDFHLSNADYFALYGTEKPDAVQVF